MTLLKRIYLVITLLVSSVALSLVLFPFLYEPLGVQQALILCISLGIIVGVIWARTVIKRKLVDDYSLFKLSESPDIVETWEKERIREKMKEDNSDRQIE